MPRDAAQKRKNHSKPKGGKRPTAAEEERRFEAVENLLTDGMSRARIVADMSKRFGIAARTTDDYIAKVRDAWVANAAENMEFERAAAVKRIREISRRASEDGSYTAAIQAERLVADILGYNAPRQSKVEVTGTSTAGVVVYLPQIEKEPNDPTALEGQTGGNADSAGGVPPGG